MIFERISKPIYSINKLREELSNRVIKYEPVMPKPAFGGWSILSSSGSYKDGWQTGQIAYKTDASGTTYYDTELAKSLGMKPESDHKFPTEIATTYVLEVIEEIRRMGLQPCRARWTVLKANSSGSIHRDALDSQYRVRLHIPVVTNPACLFHADGESGYAPADGAMYFVRVNRLHQIENKSSEDRYHILMDVTDTKGISKFHKFSQAP